MKGSFIDLLELNGGGHVLLPFGDRETAEQLTKIFDKVTIVSEIDQTANNPKITFIKDNPITVELEESTFDVVIQINSFNEIPRSQRKKVISNYNKFLKNNGKLVIIEQLSNTQNDNQKLYLDYLNFKSEIESGTKLNFLKSQTIKNYLENSNFNIDNVSTSTNLFDNLSRKELITYMRNELFDKISSDRTLHDIFMDKYVDMLEKLMKYDIESLHYIIIDATNIKSESKVEYNIVTPSKSSLLPREKLIKGKVDDLEIWELVSIILGMGSKSEDVFSLSKRILREYGSVALIEERNPKKLQEVLNIREVDACKIVSIFELGRRFYSKRHTNRKLVRDPIDVFEYTKEMRNLVKENVRGLYLNAKKYIIHDEIISIGHLTGSLVHPREVFRPAIEHSAAAVVLVHNHPSGDSTPSDGDDKVTKTLLETGKIIGIDLVDHIIIGNDNYFSYAEHDKLILKGDI